MPIAIAIAFIGALFIIKPTFGNENIIASMAGFIGGMCAGAAYTCVRQLGIMGENGKLIVFLFSAFSSLVKAEYSVVSLITYFSSDILRICFEISYP